MSQNKMEFNIAKLNEISRARWFKTDELFQILRKVDESNLASIIITKLPERPKAGSFHILDSAKANKKWK